MSSMKNNKCLYTALYFIHLNTFQARDDFSNNSTESLNHCRAAFPNSLLYKTEDYPRSIECANPSEPIFVGCGRNGVTCEQQ